MDAAVRKNLEGFLPADAARRCNRTALISVTVVGDGGKRSGVAVRDVRVDSRPVDRPFAAPGQDATSLIVKYVLESLQGKRAVAANVTKPRLPARPGPIPAARAQQMRKAGLDIAPALAAPDPFTREAWNELGVLAPDPETFQYLVNMGKLDAMAWAEATGIAADAAKRRNQGAAAAAPLKTAKPAPAAAAAAPKAGVPAPKSPAPAVAPKGRPHISPAAAAKAAGGR
ncbi:hypothetical protein MNEG_12508 [Monoraphidium neglectum]|uniref:Uncharacterized protein n=1 Tax=Monoraphidium neglectum TaxID=145388 RepID=A0A0D2KI09_9CHLO|nr:hypothetical protein MNEG_12508 [Monoraphidium neglectum]KIY95453.1 hypothetical protein MNEG_12508 [Monoraphidium neglectum]|eukprot:XP_013894473.1 hypothetical protein MNEG_12508 [Monoraphidium neglectum]